MHDSHASLFTVHRRRLFSDLSFYCHQRPYRNLRVKSLFSGGSNEAASSPHSTGLHFPLFFSAAIGQGRRRFAVIATVGQDSSAKGTVDGGEMGVISAIRVRTFIDRFLALDLCTQCYQKRCADNGRALSIRKDIQSWQITL